MASSVQAIAKAAQVKRLDFFSTLPHLMGRPVHAGDSSSVS